MVATAVAVALVVSAPSQAAPTAVERTSATSFNYALPADATSLNFTLPGDSTALNFARKAG